LFDHNDLLLFHNRHLLTKEAAVLDVTLVDDIAVGLADVAGFSEVASL
jgi:hypothetical protein